MKHKGRLRLYTTGLAAASLLFAYSSAFAAHSGGDVTLRDASGNPIVDTTTPYSPKATCMAGGACHSPEEYRSTELKEVAKTQGVVDNNMIYWQSYNVHASAHGAVVGRHSQQGRNEDYSIEMKTAFEDAAFTSSPGMFGKY